MNAREMPPLRPDFALLIDCSRYDPPLDTITKNTASFSDDSFKEIYALSLRQGVFPLFYQRIRPFLKSGAGSQIRTLYKKSHMAYVQRNMRLSAELIRRIKEFDEKGIRAMAFKGPVLAQMAYGDITLRQYGDLDILVQKKDLIKAVSLLQENGYVPEIALPLKTIDAFYSCVNVIGLHKGDLRIEIHWELLSKNYAIDWTDEELWEKSDTVSINGTLLPTLAFETHLLYLCTHGCKHLFERLEWICDIDRAIRSRASIDWPSLLEKAQEKGIERMVLISLYLCRELLKLPLPEEIESKMAGDTHTVGIGRRIIALNLSTGRGIRKSFGTFALLLKMRERPSDRLRFAFRALFAPKFDDFNTLALPKSLLFLYPVIRPFRLLVKYFRH